MCVPIASCIILHVENSGIRAGGLYRAGQVLANGSRYDEEQEWKSEKKVLDHTTILSG
jgi:hypothetical protein